MKLPLKVKETWLKDSDGVCVAQVSLANLSVVEAKDSLSKIARMVNAHGKLLAGLKDALQFASNGVEYGYIDLPEKASGDKAATHIERLEALITEAEHCSA